MFRTFIRSFAALRKAVGVDDGEGEGSGGEGNRVEREDWRKKRD